MPQNALPPTSRPSLRRRLDHVGIGLAGLCAVHCLATLVLVSALGLGGHFLLQENIHRIGLFLALLELAREQRVRVRQEKRVDAIELELRDSATVPNQASASSNAAP